MQSLQHKTRDGGGPGADLRTQPHSILGDQNVVLRLEVQHTDEQVTPPCT